jgi:hypothetical protein
MPILPLKGKKSLITSRPPSLKNTKGNEDVGKEMQKKWM